MKKTTRSILFALLLAMAPIVVSAEGFSVALTDSSGGKLIEMTRFFSQFDWRSDDSVDTVRRVRPLLFIGHGTCRGKLELNLAATEAVNDANGNWLEIGALECAVSANTKVSVGRLAVAGLYSFIPPFLLHTVEHPKANTFASFGYGAQMSHSRGPWNLLVDLTGNTGREFNDEGNFDRVESSVRIGRKLGSVGSISLTAQLSEDFTRVGLDWMSDQSQRLHVWAGVYYDDQAAQELMAMTQVSYPIGFVRPHIMWDLRPDGSEEWTLGTEIFLTSHTRVIGDYEIEDDRVLGRLQFRW